MAQRSTQPFVLFFSTPGGMSVQNTLINKWNLIKLKLLHSKAINRMKRQSTYYPKPKFLCLEQCFTNLLFLCLIGTQAVYFGHFLSSSMSSHMCENFFLLLTCTLSIIRPGKNWERVGGVVCSPIV